MRGLEGGHGEQPSWLGRTEGREQSCVMALPGVWGAGRGPRLPRPSILMCSLPAPLTTVLLGTSRGQGDIISTRGSPPRPVCTDVIHRTNPVDEGHTVIVFCPFLQSECGFPPVALEVWQPQDPPSAVLDI